MSQRKLVIVKRSVNSEETTIFIFIRHMVKSAPFAINLSIFKLFIAISKIGNSKLERPTFIHNSEQFIIL